MWPDANTGWWPLLWFIGKVAIFMFAFIWLRGTLPRIRYDQLMRLGWKVLIPGALAWTLMIATIRVWRRQGGSIGVYIVGGAIIVVLMLLAWGWDTTAAKRAKEESELDAAEAEAEAEPGAFPVPPMDLPHYHGIGVYVERSIGASPESSAAEAKEVTGA